MTPSMVLRFTATSDSRTFPPTARHCPCMCAVLHCYVQLYKTQALQDYFDNTWVLTEILFAGLQGEEAFMVPPGHGLRHPLIFYYGHAAALYVNKLRAARIIRVSDVTWKVQSVDGSVHD